MAFTREDLTAYEKQPQKEVADTQEHLLAGATASKVATAADLEAASATHETNASTAKTSNSDAGTDPSGTDDGQSGDQTVTGDDGTSDVDADSSTASADPSGETDPNPEDDGTTAGELAQTRQNPKKGSAAERIQELLDLNDGYKTFGQQMQEQLKAALSENARLKGGGTQAPTTTAEATPATESKDDQMPDIADPDVNFDTDKLRVKTQKWINSQIAKGTQRVVKEITGQTAAERLEADVNAKVTRFAETHSDWEAVVAKNPVLIANQLSQPASLAVAQSEHTADILYKFGKDPGLAIKVAKMRPEQQLVKIGEITAQIVAEKAAATTTTDGSSSTKGQQKPVSGAKPGNKKSLTQAPPAHTPTKAAGSPTERDILDPNMSMDEFARRHREGRQQARVANRAARGIS